MRTKAQIHCLTGHTNTVADVKTQAADPQVRLLIITSNRLYSFHSLLRWLLVVMIVQYVFGILLLVEHTVP